MLYVSYEKVVVANSNLQIQPSINYRKHSPQVVADHAACTIVWSFMSPTKLALKEGKNSK